jgi:hypothetical protein
LRVVGFDVASAKDVKVGFRDDVKLVRYARHYKRILVCHDRHRDKPGDKETRIRIRQEIYNHGGQVIEVSGSPKQPELTSLGKILTHRAKWKEFFENNDGIVILYENRDIKAIPREALIQQVQGLLAHPTIPPIPPKSPQKPIKHRLPRPKRPEEKTFFDLLNTSNKAE